MPIDDARGLAGRAGRARWALALLAAVALVLGASPLLADRKAVEKALEGLSDRYGGLETFSASYSRTTTTPALDDVFMTKASQTATGLIRWKQASRLRLDQDAPTGEALMTDGRTVWWYLPAERQVRIYRDVDLAGELAPLLTFMSGLAALRDRFVIAEASGQDARKGQTGLVLAPKGAQNDSGHIIVYCDQGFALTGFRLSSLTGEKTDFFLSDPRVNPGFDDGLFVFEIPRGTTVIEESEG
jgi:outer membrane lipoprotein carrier protein